ncbi:MAG: hypothetical protein ACKO0V_07975 [bacterium]
MIQHKAKAWLMEFHEKTLTQAKNEVTKDWLAEFPSLKKESPMHLLRRVGPLLVGVILERIGLDSYIPCFHVHFLGNSEPSLILTMKTKFTPTPEIGKTRIEVSDHKRTYKEAARLLREQAPLSIEGPLTVKEVLEAYRKFSTTPVGGSQLANLYQDAIKLATFFGFTEQAKGLLQEILECTEGDGVFKFFNGREAYIERMRDAIAHPETIRETIEQQIVQHKVGRLPFSEFADAVPVTALNEPKA